MVSRRTCQVRRMAPPAAGVYCNERYTTRLPQPQRPPPPVQTQLDTARPAEFVTCDQTIERLMNRRKQFRAVATRFDKLGVRYQATVTVADIFIWLRANPDRGQSPNGR